jgi:hypothetical protein
VNERRPPPRKAPPLQARALQPDSPRFDERAHFPLDPDEPARLTQDHELGGLLERANVAYRSGLDEHSAFQRLESRLEPRTHAAWGWRPATVAAALSIAAGAVLFVSRDEEPSHVALGPELSSSRSRGTLEREPLDGVAPAASNGARLGRGTGDERADGEDADPAPEASRDKGFEELEAVSRDASERAAARNQRVTGELDPQQSPGEGLRQGSRRDDEPRARRDDEPSQARAAEPQRALATDPRSEADAQLVTPKTRLSPSPRSSEPVAPVNPTPAVDVPTSMTPPAPNCLDLAGQGEARAAELCYAQRAAGSGLSAEAALYDMARLRRDALQDANGALAALNDYRQRFPNGSLLNEVGLSRLELLSELGRGREALRESEALLASAKGQERAAELHMLRGNVLRRELSDGRAAAAEYAKVEAFGGTLGAEATRLRGVSLEAIGDAPGALEAYRRYLGLAQAEKRAEVARRVEVLLAKQREGAP